jgi:hypothetical protein
MRPVGGQLDPIEDKGHGGSRTLVYLGSELPEKRFDLLPVEATLQVSNLAGG